MGRQKKDKIRRGKPGAVAVSSKRSGSTSLAVCAVRRLSNAPSRQIGKNSNSKCQDLYVDSLLPNSLGLFFV